MLQSSAPCASNLFTNLTDVCPGDTFALFLRCFRFSGCSDMVRFPCNTPPVAFSLRLSNATSLCPCCSEFSYCGMGSQLCLAGCNPFQSNTLDSCKASPICKSTIYTFSDESRILTNSTLNDGNATACAWVLDGGEFSVANGELSLL